MGFLCETPIFELTNFSQKLATLLFLQTITFSLYRKGSYSFARSFLSRFVLKALFKPISDYLLKPFFVSVHNCVCVPVCGVSHHFCILCTHAVSPFCRLMSILCCSNGNKARHHQPISGDMSPI